MGIIEVKKCHNTYTNSVLWMHGMTTMDPCPSKHSMLHTYQSKHTTLKKSDPPLWVKRYPPYGDTLYIAYA